MSAFSRSLLTASILAAGVLFSVPVMAYNVVVGNFGGTSTNGSFNSHVWTPAGEPSNLDVADLLAEITASNVEIITNGSGNITVDPTFSYTLAVNRQLTLSAQGSVTIRGINATGTGELSVVADATGAVTNQAAGLYTNGGSFTSYGTNFSSSAPGLETNGGDILIHHTGTVTIAGGGIHTIGGSFTSWGTGFVCSSTGLDTNGGNVVLNHTGAISFTDNGVQTGGGSFTSSGTDVSAGRLETGGGNATLNHTGNVNITEGGIETDGGDLRINSSATASFENNGVQTNGGTILVQSNGQIHVNAGTGFTSGGSNNGGDITLRSATGITLDCVILTLPGTGGQLFLQGNTAAIVLNQAPALGAGDIILYVGSLQPASIPTLSEWGMIIMSLVLMGAAVQAIRQKTGFTPQA